MSKIEKGVMPENAIPSIQKSPGTISTDPPGYRSLLTAQKHFDLMYQNLFSVHPLLPKTPQKIFPKNT
jgi:hypothetical protein